MYWYEETEISFEDARRSIKSKFKEEDKMSYWVLEECLQDEYKQYDSFGSHRGFYTFVLPAVVKEARKKNEFARKKALQTLRRATPLIVWMNHILYRPPSIKKEETTTTSRQKSLRYEKIKANFEEQNNKYKTINTKQ